MKKAKKGLVAAVTGIIMGIGLTTVVNYLVNNGTVPGYWSWVFVLVSIVGNLATLKSMRRGAVFYTIGWLAGSVLLRDLLGPADFVFNIAAPAAILVLRVWLWIKKPFR